MWFFDFLKKLAPKPEASTQELTLVQLEEKLTNQVAQQQAAVNKEVAALQERIKAEQKNLLEALQTLAQAKTTNPNYPERIKQIVEGNRKSYITRMERFSKNLPFSKEHEALLTAYAHFDKQLDDLTKSTVKNYKILMEFFANEITTIVDNIKLIDDLIKQTKTTLTATPLATGKTLQKKLINLQAQLQKKQTLQQELEEHKKQLHEKTTKVREKEKELKTLEQGKEHQQYAQLLTKQQQRTEELEEHKKQLSRDFSSITTALKKYERLTEDKKRIRHYIENPQEALQADTTLAIVPLFNHLRETIINGTLELKQGKKEKTIHITNTFTNTYFTKYLAQEEALQQELQTLHKELEQTRIAQTVEEQRKTIQQAKDEETTLLQTIREKMEQLENINIGTATAQLEKEVQKQFNEPITIVR